MKPIVAETSITINAPLQRVWQVIVDTDNYGKWNPFVIRAERKGDVTRVGTAMKLYVQWSNGGAESSDEIITDVQLPLTGNGNITRAHWGYKFNGLLRNLNMVNATRYQWLEQQAGGPTIYRTREEFGGWLAMFIPLKKVQDGFERHANALKTYVERM